MSVVINSNYSAAVASRNLSKASDALRKSLARLSSGTRIIDGSDDAGGLSVASKINSRLSRTHATRQNVQNAVSFLQVQDGALRNAAEIVSRMSELRTMASDITKNESDIANYNYEFRELQNELNSLRAEKFNGVSLFGTLMNADENLVINTSDDGSGEGIEIPRVGLFENLKSMFGTDGKLNTGSFGAVRQLVGDFVTDAGILDASPSYSTRNYSKGDVVFRQGTTDAESGYFMALKEVMAGTKVEDSQDSSSNWIRIADESGKGFSEIYPSVDVYDQNNSKVNASGDAVAYLKGDIVKVNSHWADPNSFVYLKANQDISRNLSIETFLDEGLGSDKAFDYVSVNRANDQDGRPTTEFLRQNSKWSDADVSVYDPSSMSSFFNMISAQGVNNNYTPGHVKVDIANDPYLNGTSSSVVVTDPNKQEDTITDILGGSQVKQIDFDNIYGDDNDVFQIEVQINGDSQFFSYDIDNTAINADVDGSSEVARGILNKILQSTLEDGSTLAFDTTNSGIRQSTDNVWGFQVVGTAKAGDFNIFITPSDDADDFSTTSIYEGRPPGSVVGGSRVKELESGPTLGGVNLNNAGSTHPLNNDIFQTVTYELEHKFWGDGSTISALNQATAGQLVYDGGIYYQVDVPTVASFDPMDPNFGTDWRPLAGTNLMELAASGEGGVTVAAGDTNAGAFVAAIDGATVKHSYLADKIGVQVVSEGVTYSKQVDFISGTNEADSATLTAQSLVDAINADTTGIGAIVEAEVVNTTDIKLTARAIGIPFVTTAYNQEGHDSSNSSHALPSGNGHPGTTAPVSFVVNTTKEIEAPTSVFGSATSTLAAYSVFKPASNWGIQTWDATHPHQGGDLVWNVNSGTGAPEIWEISDTVKGFWNGGTVQSGEIFLHNGTWYQAQTNDLTETPNSSSLNWTTVDPLTFSTDKTSDYMDLSNADLWTKTHYGNLVGDTIDQDYVRGDTFLHEGKHYIYVSAKGSSDYEYDPDQDGITEFEQLKDAGAIMELPMYVDTIGRGGSSDLADGVYYRPNQELEFVDRMADSGLVRTNSISRRGEPGTSDEIFNSRDDLYYGGLNPGNDGIYGTSDDTYTTTRYPHLAQAGGHVDSDADNNKDLLDTSNDLTDFSVPDFVDFIQTIANFRAMNGGTMSRLDYTTRMLDENITNLGAAYGRIMDADIAMESSNFARQNVMVQASASMVAQANQLTNVALTLLGR
jgi:flagellin-like hook-associated protein FlgL